VSQTNYTIQDSTNGLVIRVAREVPSLHRSFVALLIGAIICAAGEELCKSLWWLAVSPVVFTAVFLSLKTAKADLTISRLEFVARGNLGARARAPRVLMAADVRGLEFRDQSLLQGTNGGLYAITDGSSKLILPYLDWEQTQDVVAAIKKKLPGLSQNWR